MSYLYALKMGILVFPILALIFTFPFILNQYNKYGSISRLRVLIIYSFILYMICIYFLVILPLPNRDDVTHSAGINLCPLAFIGDFLKDSSFDIMNPSSYLKVLTNASFYTVLFNVIMTIPFGIYLRYYFKCSFRKTLFLSFILSLFFELTQLTGLYFIYPYSYRLFDVDDLITNTLGGIIGYFLAGFFLNRLPSREEIDEKALREGMEVSGFRRLTLFFLDLFLFLIWFMLFNFFYKSVIIPFIIYYIIIPLMFDGRSIGGVIINVKLQFESYKVINLVLRSIFLVIYYYVIPILFMSLINFLNDFLNLSSLFILIIDGLGILIILGFYLKNILTIIRRRWIFYDDLFKVSYVSTIKG